MGRRRRLETDDTSYHRDQYEAREEGWGDEHPAAWQRAWNHPASAGMGSGWDAGQSRYGGIGGLHPLGDWDYRDVGGSGDDYGGPEPDEGPFRGLGPKGWVRSDQAIRDELCESLARESWLDASDIEVEVRDGEITLLGRVPNREQKRIADHIAHSIPGVRDVHNRLTLWGRSRRLTTTNVER